MLHCPDSTKNMAEGDALSAIFRLRRGVPMTTALRPLALALLLACTGAAQAQGTIQSGSTYLQFVGTPLGTGSGNINLLFGSTSAFGTDMVFRYGWSYNQGVATSNRPFSSLDTPVASYAGNVATFTWANAGAGTAGFARWDAVMTVTLTEVAPTPGGTTPGQARVDTLLSFKANTGNAGSITYNLFHDLDFDIQGSSGAGGDTFSVLDASSSGGILGRATDSGSANYAEFIGRGAARYEFNTGSALRTRVGSGGTGTGNLATAAGTTVANWSSTDGAVAFQWTPTLAPGEQVSVSTSFTINTPVPEPGSLALLAGGLLGLAPLLLRRRRADQRRAAAASALA
jgi:hypothetical protein